MKDYKKHFIYLATPIHEVLRKLNDLANVAIAFVVDEDERLVGSVTDGDIRRGFLRGLNFDSHITNFIQPDPYKLKESELTVGNFNMLKEKLIKIVPLIDKDNIVIDIINIDSYQCVLPLHTVIMAGGEGIRLRPHTSSVPKPLLKIGDKPIIEHNIDRIKNHGIVDITISLKYLGEQIEQYFGNGSTKDLNIDYIWEDSALGTLGAVTLKEHFRHEHILLLNSDLLTNIDFADMYAEFLKLDADMIVATVPYRVNIPYGVIETESNRILSVKEKPTYTYYSNAGIYIFKKEFISLFEKGSRVDATDMIELLVKKGATVLNYPILSYWLDIGRHEDFEKAQEDIKHIKL